jgi:transposase-like protein
VYESDTTRSASILRKIGDTRWKCPVCSFTFTGNVGEAYEEAAKHNKSKGADHGLRHIDVIAGKYDDLKQ